MLKHLLIHRRRDGYPAFGGQRNGQQQVIGIAIGQPGDGVRRGWSDQQQVSPTRQFDMIHRILRIGLEQLSINRMAG